MLGPQPQGQREDGGQEPGSRGHEDEGQGCEVAGGRGCQGPTCGQREASEGQEEDGPDSQDGGARSYHRAGSAAHTRGHGVGAGSWHAGSFLSDSQASWVYM